MGTGRGFLRDWRGRFAPHHLPFHEEMLSDLSKVFTGKPLFTRLLNNEGQRGAEPVRVNH